MSFARYAWSVLVYNLAVVSWGAFVRATGSGAGCGRHWPMCNGQVVPRAAAVETAIEFTHRTTSGLSILLVIGLVALAHRRLPAGHAARRAAWASLGLMIVEALVGAGLVLFGWVAKDASAARGWVVAVHLVNTFLLLGALTLAAALADKPGGLTLRRRGPLAATLTLALATVLLAGATGAIAALGDTLFPSMSFAEGLRQELDGAAHALLRLRVLHPFAAVAAAIAAVLAARAALRARPDDQVRLRATALLALVGVELLAGAVNVLLLAPVWLQLVHLLLADLIWIGLVLLAAGVLSPGAAQVTPALPDAAAQHA
jgi:cytochrome c oxidase assembly protein subunit 15